MKLLVYSIILNLFFLSSILSQISSNTEIFSTSKSFNVFIEPCLENSTSSILQFSTDKKINLIDYLLCDKKRKPQHKGYFKIIVDGTVYYILPTELIFNINDEDFLKWFQKLDSEDKSVFQVKNRKLNYEYYDNLKQLAEDKKNENERLKFELENQKKRELEYKNAYIDSLTAIKKELLLVESDNSYKEKNNSAVQKRTNIQKYGGVFITGFDVNKSKYDVTSVTMSVLNVSNKRLKYVSFVFQGYNEVNDPVNLPKTLKGVGFVEIDGSGTWDFENIWFSEILDKVTIESILIVYEDGSTKTVKDLTNNIITDIEEQSDLLMYEPFKSSFYGNISLREYSFVKLYELWFYPVNFENDNRYKPCTIMPISDISASILEMEQVLKAKKQGITSNTGTYFTTEFSSMIYIVYGDNKTLISAENFELLLNRLKTLAE
jgi:hypothetical protein